MLPIVQSAFLQALGFAIANSLWQMALLWLSVQCINSLMSLSSAARYRLSVSAQFTGFIWFLITLQFYYVHCNGVLQQSYINSAGLSNLVSGNNGSSVWINVLLKTEQFLPYLSVAYLILIVFLSVRWLAGYRQTILIRKSGIQKVPVHWRLFIQKLSAQLAIRREVRIFLSECITTPVTMGFLKPMILIPVASINHLSTDQLEAVLLHELAHIKRCDYLLNIIVTVIELGLFFNPFTQLLSASIRKERENSCDDWVLQFQYNAASYAEALLRIASLQNTPQFAMAATGKKNELLNRVKRMIDKKESQFDYRKQLLAFLIITGILSSIAWLNPMLTPYQKVPLTTLHTPQPSAEIQTYPAEPMAISVENPLFNPMFFLSKPLKAEMNKNIASAQEEINHLSKEEKNGFAEVISSLPSIVAGSLEQSAAALADLSVKQEKETTVLQTAKSNPEKISTDSLSAEIPKKFKISFDKLIAQSMKEAGEGIRKAKTDMEKSLKDIRLSKAEKQKISVDLKKAMDEMKQSEFGKLLGSTMNIPGLLFSEDADAVKSVRKLSDKVNRENSSNPQYEQGPIVTDKDLSEFLPEADIDSPEFIRYPKRDIPAGKNTERRVLSPEKIQLLKKKFLEEAAKRMKPVPVLYQLKDSSETENIIIILQ